MAEDWTHGCAMRAFAYVHDLSWDVRVLAWNLSLNVQPVIGTYSVRIVLISFFGPGCYAVRVHVACWVGV